MNKFVADESQRPAAEARQSRNGHRPKAPHDLLDHRQTVLDRLADGETLDHFPVLDHVHPPAGLLDDGARIAADKGVAANVLAALDRFAEEGLALAANLAVGRERRFQIGQDAARDRNQVALAGQLQEFILSWIMHGSFLTLRRRKRHKESKV